MKNIILRATSGAIYVALIVGAVIAGGWWLVGLLCLFTVLALIEFYGLVNAEDGGENPVALVVDVAGGLVLTFGIATLNATDLSTFSMSVLGGTFLTLYLLYLIVRQIIQLYSRETNPITNLACSFMGQMYIALPLGLLSLFATLPDGRALLLAMFIMIWLNDTGAFLVGSMIGRHPMFPRISPKKSIEGLIGGFIFTIGSAFIFKYCFGQWYQQVDILTLIFMGIVVSAFATWGDLVESLIKRTLGVKDSGKLMPGHGGILDRIDSLLLVGPATLLYLVAVNLF
ncbi:MAG: phosphatidate cytidylyltransferase [Lachnoclostridium sp.]|nr:phosphatidate cytidylyltransferase [Lachnoclostridium sp.]